MLIKNYVKNCHRMLCLGLKITIRILSVSEYCQNSSNVLDMMSMKWGGGVVLAMISFDRSSK